MRIRTNEAKAAKWDAMTEDSEEWRALKADAAKWREWFVSGETSVEAVRAMAQDALRWRTVEREVADNFFRYFMNDDGDLFIETWRGTMGPFDTLSAAVDQLQERMDKEAK
jgi:hypothetical protein